MNMKWNDGKYRERKEAPAPEVDKKNMVAFLKVRIPERYDAEIERFRNKWKSNEVADVCIVYGDQVLDFTMREFLAALGFELPCGTCGGTRVVEVGEGDDIREAPCMDCGPVEEFDADDDSGDSIAE